MRGRKPDPLTISAEDRPVLEHIARSRQLPWFQVQRARIVLALAGGQRTEVLADHLDCDRTTIWRIGRCYQQRGLQALLLEASRRGHPSRISPPPGGPDRPVGLPGADRKRPAHHALDQQRLGPPSRGRCHRASHQ